MRPRTIPSDLPRGVHFRHGTYYKVIRGRWFRLCKERSQVEQQLAQFSARTPLTKAEILAYTYKVLTRSRQNARGRRGLMFALTREDIKPMLDRAGWMCAVTGVEFTLEKFSNRLPFAPSIDRIDSKKGYTRDNCRIVCVAANYAMNVWGDEVLKRLIRQGRVIDTA